METSTKSNSQPIPVRRTMMPGWMKGHFDRLNTTANIEDLCSSPPETDSGFLRDMPQVPSRAREVGKTGSNNQQQASKPVIDETFCKAALAQFQPPAHPVSAAKKTSSESGSCSGSESTHTTPSATPQSSPSLVRRIIASDITAAVPQTTQEPLENSCKWVLGGLFDQDSAQKTTIPNRQVTVRNKDSVLKAHLKKKTKRFAVSNFDLNAVSPTSW